MKPRNREINIFSLSMMDVISGAMGAFLIIMIILAQYYDSDPTTSQEVAKLTEEMVRAIEELQESRDNSPQDMKRMFDVPLEELLAALERLQALRDRLAQAQQQIKRLTDYASRLENENQELETDNQELSQANQRLDERNRELALLKPFSALITWKCIGSTAEKDQNVDLYIDDSREGENGTFAPKFDPTKVRREFWSDDSTASGRYSTATSAVIGADSWLVRRARGNDVFRVFYNVTTQMDRADQCTVDGEILNVDAVNSISPVTLSAAKTWHFAATLTVQPDGKVVVNVPTDAERSAAHQEIAARMGGR